MMDTAKSRQARREREDAPRETRPQGLQPPPHRDLPPSFFSEEGQRLWRQIPAEPRRRVMTPMEAAEHRARQPIAPVQDDVRLDTDEPVETGEPTDGADDLGTAGTGSVHSSRSLRPGAIGGRGRRART